MPASSLSFVAPRPDSRPRARSNGRRDGAPAYPRAWRKRMGSVRHSRLATSVGPPVPDLAVGMEGEEAGGMVSAGIVDVLYARTGGLSGSGAQSWWLDSPGIKGVAQRRSL